MHESSIEEEQFIIWNGSIGIRDFVTIERVEVEPDGRYGWLEEPYDMVGPFSIDELETNGAIRFAACIVMSRQKWQEDQIRLREEAFAKQRKAQEEMFEELFRFNKQKRKNTAFSQNNKKEERELLCLPVEGMLEASQIKAAFRKVAKSAHPDVGGSHELFVRITQARDILLECFA
jgi:hypothetical protein